MRKLIGDGLKGVVYGGGFVHTLDLTVWWKKSLTQMFLSQTPVQGERYGTMLLTEYSG